MKKAIDHRESKTDTETERWEGRRGGDRERKGGRDGG